MINYLALFALTVASTIPLLVPAQFYNEEKPHRRSLSSEMDKQINMSVGGTASKGVVVKSSSSKAGKSTKAGKSKSGLSLQLKGGKSGKGTSSKSQKGNKQSSKASSKASSGHGGTMDGSAVASVPTSKPTCNDSKQENQLNICLALDMSGSLCNKGDGGDCISWTGEPCDDDVCRDYSFTQATCCSNFAAVKDFSSSLVTALEEVSSGIQFSIVNFASDAEIASELSAGDTTLSTLDNLAYSGGLTNHESSIQKCQNTFENSTAERKNIILLVTDGVSTKPFIDPTGKADAAATSAKDEGTTIIPVFISTSSDKEQEGLDLMSKLSSTDEVVTVDDFDGLASISESLVIEVASC